MPDLRPLIASLNPAQREAVETTEGPLLVLAGAGTGKTRVVTTRIAYLIAKGVRPEHVLAVTFTNKAAAEMRERLKQMIGARGEEVIASTFHSFCLNLLRERPEDLGMPRGFTICDPGDQRTMITKALREVRAPASAVKPREALSLISLAKNRLEGPDQLARSVTGERGELVALAWERYQDALRRRRKLDFDDLLLETRRLLQERPLQDLVADRHRYMLVDEYQDTNGPQFEIVRGIAGRHRNLCVVGDDDQSIYGWRGADMSKILSFEKTFPGAKVVKLETNYRSTAPILRCANRLIAHNTGRHEKQLHSALGDGEPIQLVTMRDEEVEAEKVVQRIAELVEAGHALDEFAILFRTAVQARPFESELRLKGIPYTLVGGQSFFDRKEVRDVLGYLRLLDSPDDEEALLRVLNAPPRGIGKATIDRCLAHATAEGTTLAEVFAAGDVPGVKADRIAPAQRLLTRLATLRSLHPDSTSNLVPLIRATIDEVGYEEEVRRSYPDEAERTKRWEAVDEILNAAENYARRSKRPRLQRFIDELLLKADERDDAEKAAKRLSVTLMTLHASKGLEFPRVFLVGLEEGILPHLKAAQEDTIEEERRLAYVGITRAQRALQMSFCLERARGGQRVTRHPSRFVLELAQREPPAGWLAAGQEAPPRPRGRRGGRRRRRR